MLLQFPKDLLQQVANTKQIFVQRKFEQKRRKNTFLHNSFSLSGHDVNLPNDFRCNKTKSIISNESANDYLKVIIVIC